MIKAPDADKITAQILKIYTSYLGKFQKTEMKG